MIPVESRLWNRVSMPNPVQHPEAHLFHHRSIHLHPQLLFHLFLTHHLSLTVRPLICGGPPGKAVSFPATAPWAGLTWRLERGTEEVRLQSNMRYPNDLQLQHHPQQLDLRRGDPASRWHPSQVTCSRINSKWKLQIFSTYVVLEQSFSLLKVCIVPSYFPLCWLILPFYDACEENATFWGNDDG